MAVTKPKSQIPTVAQAVQRFRDVKGLTQRVVEHRSVLQGPKTKRVTGRRASGTALAASNLGGLRFDRVTASDFSAWFGERHPAEMAADSKKRGRSSLKQLLDYAIANGWADETVLTALPRRRRVRRAASGCVASRSPRSATSSKAHASPQSNGSCGAAC